MESSHGNGAGGDVVLLGSINADHFIYVDAFPQPGETILARGGEMGLGGKGANQAVAAGLAGARVHLIGRVGRDAAAGFVRERLEGFGVDTEHLTPSEAPTGAAYITVDGAGENTIAVVSGANAETDLTALEETARRVFAEAASRESVHAVALTEGSGAPAPGHRSGDAVVGLSQGETRAEMIEAFAAHCAEREVRFVLNLAPVIDLDASAVAVADPLILNEGEAQALLERRGGSSVPAAPAEGAAQALELARGMVADGVARSVVVTLGGEGAVVATAEDAWHQASPAPAEVVDTTGAGDAFVGALGPARGQRRPPRGRAVGRVRGSAAVASRGTTASYPSREELAGLVRRFAADGR
ncbi:PfkB family carbohydrate kinase [Rothia sp. AR01]|uniref:Ribokinase n=1 Tax=Rothia santali TaxID=2949643 RepID=A0A9X2HHQ7_9MICC|nr:PfkB family carbohydrate kinase [Rothia santali]MCP3426782.1 PfkB family carbohydrate kinase [Rothia santali]